jgi:hypothetical protein
LIRFLLRTGRTGERGIETLRQRVEPREDRRRCNVVPFRDDLVTGECTLHLHETHFELTHLQQLRSSITLRLHQRRFHRTEFRTEIAEIRIRGKHRPLQTGRFLLERCKRRTVLTRHGRRSKRCADEFHRCGNLCHDAIHFLPDGDGVFSRHNGPCGILPVRCGGIAHGIEG